MSPENVDGVALVDGKLVWVACSKVESRAHSCDARERVCAALEELDAVRVSASDCVLERRGPCAVRDRRISASPEERAHEERIPAHSSSGERRAASAVLCVDRRARTPQGREQVRVAVCSRDVEGCAAVRSACIRICAACEEVRDDDRTAARTREVQGCAVQARVCPERSPSAVQHAQSPQVSCTRCEHRRRLTRVVARVDNGVLLV